MLALALHLGDVAFAATANGLLVSDREIAVFSGQVSPLDDHANVGGLFDFEIHGLTVPGGSVQVVIPQRVIIPVDPFYRKLMPAGWQNFTVDERNVIASAAGNQGACPPPDDVAYTAGLTPGHWCVQLWIEDGGPNDADGIADGVVTDPGGIAVAPITTQQTKTAPASGGGGSGALHPVALLLLVSIGWQMRRGLKRSAQTNKKP